MLIPCSEMLDRIEYKLKDENDYPLSFIGSIYLLIGFTVIDNKWIEFSTWARHSNTNLRITISSKAICWSNGYGRWENCLVPALSLTEWATYKSSNSHRWLVVLNDRWTENAYLNVVVPKSRKWWFYLIDKNGLYIKVKWTIAVCIHFSVVNESKS